MSRAKKQTIPYRNRSPHGWWIASYLIRLQYSDEDVANDGRRCLAWENTIILRGKSREEAYAKALRMGRLDSGGDIRDQKTGRHGTWIFEGITSFLPIYDELKDGAEVLWIEHDGRAVKTIKALVRSKADLETFNDQD